MAEYSLPWTKGAGGDGGPYSADTWADWLEMLWQTDEGASEGVVRGFQGELHATNPLANTVRVDTGGALVKGRPYWNTAAVDVEIPTPVGDTRVDRIVLRSSWSAQTVRITRLAGTEGSGAPPLTQTDGVTWDIPLWQVTITPAGEITLTDERSWLHAGIRVGTDNLDDRAVTEEKQALGTFVPVGGIILYSGALGGPGNKHPVVGGVVHTNWHLCDGTDGTPDLRDRFVVGAGSQYALGATGGATTHTHTVNIASDFGGSHAHTTDPTSSANEYWGWAGGEAIFTLRHTHPVSTAPHHQHGVNGTTGVGGALPPYYGVYYLIRTA